MPQLPTILLFILVTASAAAAADLDDLAACTAKVFTEIAATRKWSGKPPKGCPAQVLVERRDSGVFVTAWSMQSSDGGWVMTGLTAAQGYGELTTKKDTAAANRDIAGRVLHLGRCLDSINRVNDPLDCRDHATKTYVTGEQSGVYNKRLIWLTDDGRHTVVQFAYGNTSATPSPPADLLGGEPLPAGLILDLKVR